MVSVRTLVWANAPAPAAMTTAAAIRAKERRGMAPPTESGGIGGKLVIAGVTTQSRVRGDALLPAYGDGRLLLA